MTACQPFLIGDGWQLARDGDPTGLALYERHYSARKTLARRRKRRTQLFVGPGFKLVLIHATGRALFVWWRQRHRRDRQAGVNCAVFRNEGAGIASELILGAERVAWSRWPGERLFTFVDPDEVGGSPPGNCFRHAGWRPCGLSRDGLIVLEKLEAWA